MELIVSKQTDGLETKRNLEAKIYKDKMYFLWNQRDTDFITQVWFATSNLNGSEFVATQLLDSIVSMNEPVLDIYEDEIYLSWYAISEETGRYQIWVASMSLDGSDLDIIFTTDHTYGALTPKITVKNDIIYLAYQLRGSSTSYYHMAYAKLNIDGSDFHSNTASNSPNETVRNVEIFTTDDPTDNKVYYMWTREYFIGDPPSLHIYSCDSNLLSFEAILILSNTTSGKLYVQENKVYFTYGNKCCVVNTDGNGYEILSSCDGGVYSSLQVTDNIIDLACSIKTSSSFPVAYYQLLSASLDINTLEYSEVELANEMPISTNDNVNIHLLKLNNILHYAWQQYDENNDYQIWTAALGNLSYLSTTMIDGPDTIWSEETAIYDIRVDNVGYLPSPSILEVYTHNAANELIILDTVAIPELEVDGFIEYIIDVDTTGFPDGNYSICAKTDCEEYL